MIKKFNVKKTRQLNVINKILSVFYRKPHKVKEIPIEELSEILIVDFALMGDMVMDIPFLKTIRHNCPKAKITMVGMEWSKIILGDQGLVDKFIIFNGKDVLSSPTSVLKGIRQIRKALKKINQCEYDLGIEPKGDLRHTMFMHYTRCRRTASYNYTGGDYLVTDSFSPKKETKHLIDEKLDLLEMLNFRIYGEDRLPELKLQEPWTGFASDFAVEHHLAGKTMIGIHPGASNTNKQFRKYPELVKKICQEGESNRIFLVFEGPKEDRVVDPVCKALLEASAEHIRIKKKTKEYVSLVSLCNFMICNDSAAGHIAAAYGIPVLVIFGAVKAETAIPRGRSKVMAISHDLSCKPCTLPVCPKGTEECIKGIGSEEVYEGWRKLIV